MASDPRIGEQVAGYRLVSLLGRGGMSTVYVAEDLRLKRQVALKLLAPELAEAEAFRERFVHESQVAAGMEHANIVPIYEAGEADGHLFIAMRWIRGTDLRRLLEREGPLEPGRAVRIMRDVASALDAAHAAGLVHRDVKPANILLIEGGASEGSDLVYLSDFGLTKRLESEGGLTKTGQFVGTVDYVAPEQIEGRSVDGRADVYSLACVLFESLTGKVPYARDSQVAALYAHLREKPPLLTSFRPDLPSSLDRVFGRALSKSAQHRYPTAGEFVTAARDAIGVSSGEQPSASAPSISAALGRRPLALVGLAAIAATLVAGGILFAYNRAGGQAQGRDTPSPSASAEASPASYFRTITREPTPDEHRLLGYVPEGIRPSCQPSASAPSGSLGAVVCAGAAQQVQYALFPTRDAMDAAFAQNVAVLDAPSGDCANQHRAFGPYGVGGEVTGQVVCYQIGGRSQIEWTDERIFVYSIAIRPDLGDLSLFEWWANQAGPVDPTAGGSTIGKDVSTSIPKIPSGWFLTSITEKDARSRLLRFNVTKITAGRATAWAGTWGLSLVDGSYSLTHSGEAVESGTYVLGKGPVVVFDRDSGTCEGADPATYVLSTSAGRIVWTASRSREACLPGPWPVNVHEWLRAPTGEIVFGKDGGIVTRDIGTDRPAVVVPDALGVSPVWSPDGTKILFSDSAHLFIMNADGSGIEPLSTRGPALDPAWSPLGSLIAFHSETEKGSNLSVIAPDGSGERALTSSKRANIGRPSWSPDGDQIAFRSDDAIFVVRPDGSGLTLLARSEGGFDAPTTWTPEGDRILVWGTFGDVEGLFSMRTDGTDLHVILPAPPGVAVLAPDVSPDGRWLILGGEWDSPAPLFLVSIDGSHVFQLTQAPVSEPRWRPAAA